MSRYALANGEEFPMPEINLASLGRKARKFAEKIVTRGKNKGQLRASKPQIRSPQDGEVAYVWRNVAFFVSPIPSHHCMPVMAEYDLDPCEIDETIRKLDRIVDEIVNSVPKIQWFGVQRWNGLI